MESCTSINDDAITLLLSKNSECKSLLNLSRSKITDKSLLLISEKCPNLQMIYLDNLLDITKEGLFYVLKKCKFLVIINLFSLPLEFLDPSFLDYSRFSSLVYLKKIEFSGNNFDPLLFKQFCEKLNQNIPALSIVSNTVLGKRNN